MPRKVALHSIQPTILAIRKTYSHHASHGLWLVIKLFRTAGEVPTGREVWPVAAFRIDDDVLACKCYGNDDNGKQRQPQFHCPHRRWNYTPAMTVPTLKIWSQAQKFVENLEILQKFFESFLSHRRLQKICRNFRNFGWSCICWMYWNHTYEPEYDAVRK